MKYDKERHKELVRFSLYLESQGKNICIESREKNLELLNYNIAVEEHVYWTHRKNFVLILKNLFDNTVNFEKFRAAFSILYRKVRKEIDIFKKDLEYIDKFEPSKRSYRFALAMGSIYRQFEEIEDEYLTEQEVTDYVKEAYLKFQIFEE